MIFFVAYGQQINFTKQDSVILTIEKDLQYVKGCLHNYQKQHVTSFLLTGSGLTALAITPLLSNDSKNQKYVIMGGGVLSLVGAIIFVDSEKWLRKTAIKPIPGGISIGIGAR